MYFDLLKNRKLPDVPHEHENNHGGEETQEGNDKYDYDNNLNVKGFVFLKPLLLSRLA